MNILLDFKGTLGFAHIVFAVRFLSVVHAGLIVSAERFINTVEPHLTATSLVRKPPHYSHRGSVPNCI